jgi:peptide/nickel transport system substrate-binding protein
MRKLALLNVLAILALVLAACGQPTAAPTEAPAPTEKPEEPVDAIEQAEETPTPVPTADPASANEAPMLAEMVRAGELPPLEERLPKDVQTIAVVDSIGEYGGTWHAVAQDPGLWRTRMKLYEPPVRWKADLTGYEPGLAKSWEYSNNDLTITFNFREGVKWSDGVPFTMDDMKFWWEDLAQNDDYGAISVPWWARNSDGSACDMEFPDDYTWVLTFDEPQYVMPSVLAQGFWEHNPLMKPRHYLEQFHPDYNADSDYDTLTEKDDMWANPDFPVLFAWDMIEYDRAANLVTFERNPYYWKVDPEGNQLPYIDYVVVEIVTEKEARLLNISQGKYDATFRGAPSPTDIPFLADQAEANGYHLHAGWMNGAGGWPAWLINQDYHEELEYDPATETEEAVEIRELLRNTTFRKGLSVALDRERLIDVVWDGIGTAQQATISPQAWHWASDKGQEVFQAWATADAEYDPELAMERFDSIGFVDADGDGLRDLPSGKPFTLIMDLGDWSGPQICTDSTEVFRSNLEDVGIDVVVKDLIGQPDWGIRGDNGLYMIRIVHVSEVDIWTYPDWVFPLRGGGEGTRAFPMQGRWNQTGGEEGWEPEPDSPAARMQAIYYNGLKEPDVEKRHQLFYDAVQILIDEGPFTLGASGDQPMPVVVKDNFHNVPEYGVLGPWAPGSPGNTNPEQYWIEQ